MSQCGEGDTVCLFKTRHFGSDCDILTGVGKSLHHSGAKAEETGVMVAVSLCYPTNSLLAHGGLILNPQCDHKLKQWPVSESLLLQ